MTVIIKTLPNALDKNQVQINTFKANQSLTAILCAEVPNFCVMATPPIDVLRNSHPWPPANWDLLLLDGDIVEISIRPRDPITALYIAIAAIVGVVAATAMAPADNYTKTSPDGSPIYDVNAQGNRVRMMGILPELFGTHGTFPCLVNPPHRYYFEDNEYLLLMTFVSCGYLSLTNNDIQIGNTPISQYAGDIDTQILGPGEDVSGHPAYLNAYTSPEVGSTSGGGSGIELEGAANTIAPIKVVFNETKITVYQQIDGVIVPWWPAEWEAGLFVEILGSPGAKDVIESNQGGGYTDLSGDDKLYYLSSDALLHDCRVGDSVDYPVDLSEFNYEITRWDRGVIGSIFTGQKNGVDFYVVSILGVDGLPLGNNVVPGTLRNAPLRFLGKDDGTYKVISTTDDIELLKYYPDTLSPITEWSSFFNIGDAAGVSLVSSNPLEGKPIGPFYVCPINELTNEIRVDIKFSEGIGYLKDNGKIEPRELDMMFQWRETETAEWVDHPFSRGGETRDQLGNTIAIELGKYCRPQFRAYRISGKADDTRTFDTVEVVRLKAILESKTKYHDGTTLAVRIRGTNSLSRSAENKLFCVPTRLLHVPDANGAWSGDNYDDPTNMVATNDIAPVLRYICHDVALDDSNLGQDDLIRLHNIWQSRSDTFAAQFDNKDTFWAAIKRLLSVGFSVPTLEFGQIIPVRDEPRTQWDHMYQPGNMTGKGLSRQDKLFDLDESDGVEVEYFSNLTWKSETALCLLPGDLGVNPKKVKAFGITDHQQAWTFGMRERRLARYARTQYKWGTEMDGFNSRYLSYVALADDVPGYSQSGQLYDWRPLPGGAWLKLDADIKWETGKTHYLALRKPDGQLSGPYQAIKLTGLDELQIVGELDFTPDFSGRQELPLWQFGTSESWTFPALVTSVKPSGTDKVNLTARNYDDRVYIDDNSVAPDVGNDPVLGMIVLAMGNADVLSCDKSMQCFNAGDMVQLSVDSNSYLVKTVADHALTLLNVDGSPAAIAFLQQPATVMLLKRG